SQPGPPQVAEKLLPARIVTGAVGAANTRERALVVDRVPDAVTSRRATHDLELRFARAPHQDERDAVASERQDGIEERLARRLEERPVDEDERLPLDPGHALRRVEAAAVVEEERGVDELVAEAGARGAAEERAVPQEVVGLGLRVEVEVDLLVVEEVGAGAEGGDAGRSSLVEDVV